MIRVILDTNVLLAALLSSRGAPARILEAWERNLFKLVICPDLIAELRNVVQRPFFRSRLRAGSPNGSWPAFAKLAIFYRHLPLTTGAPDAKDNFLLALADVSQSGFLVTGDKGLLSLREHGSAKIITPAAFVEILETQVGKGT